MKIIVTGSRHNPFKELVYKTLHEMMPTMIVEGGAPGVDTSARQFAKEFRIEHDRVDADWDKYGNAAGPIRNKAMLLKHRDALVVAFPGGNGTMNCIKTAKELGMTVIQIRSEYGIK